ncbi:MAG: alanine--tRNA ligase [Candidatus Omnitrophica bacterium]|nr:alanine--tRNA ligase [Candidatus Omnitrophota bacterium]
MKTDEIRKLFLEFFHSKDHQIVASDSLVPKDDPTLLFTGAGMNQFKEKFLGRNVTYRRAVSSQKCIRTGDLENVGRTPSHHTFFEMLGNFSFGDYFKKEAIFWAWEFFTKTLKIAPEKLWVSVYKDDTEAYVIWKDMIKLPESRIMKFGEKENFWPSEAPTKGPNGPCGPCSEIFYDWGKGTGCGRQSCSPACGCGRFIEVWNLVFTQFDRQSDGSLKPLPTKNIDTGMGLERIASVMQGVKTNFEIDIFSPIVDEVKKMLYLGSAIRGSRTVSRCPNVELRSSKINAIADHIRAVAFAIADGVMPSNEERGYVVRKLIRRALSHANDIGIRKPFLYKLVGIVADVMKAAYPEVKARREEIAQIVKKEEESFLFVIETQLPKVEEAFKALASSKTDKKKLAQTAFNFYDTYGMPYEMLEEVAEKFKLKIDERNFENLLEKQREQSRSKSKIKTEIFTETFAKKVEALGLKTEFLGYEKAHSEAKVVAVLGVGEVILDRTPFYGESGGQVGDWGTIETESGKMEVEDAKRIGETIVHVGKMLKGKILKGEKAKVSIDEKVRKKTAANHTATHLLQAALKKVLGEHVRQTGSLVDNEHLRFDFTHMKKMETREIARVEELVNEAIKKAITVTKKIDDIDTAKRDGAVALFGEKYGEKVRVVSVGDLSKELCGGTHVGNTKEIGLFRITSESSIASGTRRIEAVTGEAAKEWVREREEAERLRLRLEAKNEEAKKAMDMRLKEETEKIDSFLAKADKIGSVKLVSEVIEDVSMDVLRKLSDRIKAKEKSSVIVLATKDDSKVSFIVTITPDLSKEKALNAGELAREFAGLIGGSGGGKPDFAQGGGKDVSKLDKAMEDMREAIKARLK